MAINVKDKLVTLESLGVAYSAEQDAREEADQALSTRIDNIVAPEGDPSLTEVSDARVSGSTTHNTLKARLDADKAAIETEISGINESLGNVPNVLVKSAEQLISDKRTFDKVPYKYRASASGKSDRAYDMIVGGTVLFNQLANDIKDTYTSNGVTLTKTDSTSGTIAGTATANSSLQLSNKAISIVKDHVYLVPIIDGFTGTGTNKVTVSGFPLSGYNGGVFKSSQDYSGLYIRIDFYSGCVFDVTNYKHQIFDLTAMFGAVIADYIYALEQATAGAGVALFRQLFPNDYYPYNAGSLISVAGLSAKEVVGFNLLDFVPEYNVVISAFDVNKSARVLKGHTYEWFHEGVKNATTWRNAFVCYDNSGVRIIGSSAVTVLEGMLVYNVSGQYFVDGGNRTVKSEKFTTNFNGYIMPFFLLGDTTATSVMVNPCIHLVGDGAKNGTYEPYHKTVYPLDNSLTLRGIPVLKDGKIEFDGDTYASDGTVTRRYAERTYQSGDESLANAITDGTNTIYKLSTPTTETATPYTSPQIVDPYGTEEYISETVCPVGHITEYPENLRAKIDGLPWDLSMIAPVETAYKATRNYTTGQLLIVDNVLYKVTSNIANGGMIAVGTNVVATTLSEVIASLS